MANTILLKRSTTAGKVPLSANVSLGELSINTTDGRLYTNRGGSSIVDLTQNDPITLSGDATGTSTNPLAGNAYSNLSVTLSTVNSNTGVWGGFNGTNAYIPSFTVNGKGLTTAAGNIQLTSSGAGNLTISGTASTITIALPTTGPGAVTAGNASYVPVITTDVYGRVTSLSNVAIAAQTTTISLAGTTGTGSVTGGGTLTFASNNGITATAAGSTITISSPQDLRTSATPTFAGLTSTGTITGVTGGTGSYTSATGESLVVAAGGIGVTGDSYFTGNVGHGGSLFVANLVISGTGATAGNITGVNYLTATAINAVTLGNTGAQGIFGNITTTNGLFWANGVSALAGTYGNTQVAAYLPTYGGAITASGLQAVAIGNVTPGTAAFTTANATTITATTVNAATIGNTGSTLTGTLSTVTQNSVTTMTGLTTIGAVGVTTTVSGNLYVGGNLTIAGNSVSIASSTLSVQDPIINLHTPQDLTPLTSNDGADIGLKFHYYTVAAGDSAAFLGRANDTGYLEWYDRGTDTANVFAGTSYGTIKTGGLVLANARVLGGGLTANTGTLQVWGDGSITGNLYAGAMYDGGNRTLNTSTTHSNSGGDVAVSGAYNALVLTLNTVNSSVGTFGNAVYNQALTINGKGLITSVSNVLITPAWTSITSTPTTVSGYGITDALTTSSTVDGGTY
jgi:hypothetical protein